MPRVVASLIPRGMIRPAGEGPQAAASVVGYTATGMIPALLAPPWVTLLLLAPPADAPGPWAVDPTPVRSFRSFDGQGSRLPQATIMAMLQDDAGTLWIATLDGAATFDGR